MECGTVRVDCASRVSGTMRGSIERRMCCVAETVECVTIAVLW